MPPINSIPGGVWSTLSEMEMIKLESLLNSFEKHLNDSRKEFEDWMDNLAQNIEDSENREDFYEAHSEEYWQLAEEFPKLMRESFLVTVYSFLESHLIRICDDMYTRKKLPIPVSELRGNSLDKVKTYLGKIAGVAFPSEEKEWGEIRNYVKLRNFIVHEAGAVFEYEAGEHLLKYAKRKGLVKDQGYNQGRLFLTREFCEEVLQTVSSFLNQLYKAMHRYSKVSQG